jgi:predicted tellurium resistance membrane protein TerC
MVVQRRPAGAGTLDRMDLVANPETWIALLTLTVMEIVLGIDNVVFISVLVQRLPVEQRDRARSIGLGLAMLMRILLLLSITWIAGLTEPVVTVGSHPVSVRDLILIAGGLFLIWKATTEIHEALEGERAHAVKAGSATMRAVLMQVVLLDVVFSLDSVLTAVGMANDVPVMIAAVVIAVGVMLFASGPISRFVHEHPTVKMLALSFLLLIGVTLLADGIGLHVPKGYVYAAMGFSVFVEALNHVARRRRERPIELRPTFVKDEPAAPTT